MMNEDLDRAFETDVPLQPHVPYQAYCDNLFMMRTSQLARVAAKYHANELQELASHAKYLWPPIGKGLVIQKEKRDGCVHLFSAKALQNLCTQHRKIAPSLVLKAATALFLISTTKHTHAIFSHVEAGRDKFPFLPKSILENAPNLQASDVGGQLFQLVIDLIEPQTHETTIQFLQRLQQKQDLQHEHAAAPWSLIMEALNSESAELFSTAATTCFFNWLGIDPVSASSHLKNIEVLDAVLSVEAPPFANNCGLRRNSKGSDQIMLHLRGAVLSIEELRQAAAGIEKATCWLSDVANWSRPVVEYLS